MIPEFCPLRVVLLVMLVSRVRRSGSAAKLELVERHAFRARVYEVGMRIVWPFAPKLLDGSVFFFFFF